MGVETVQSHFCIPSCCSDGMFSCGRLCEHSEYKVSDHSLGRLSKLAKYLYRARLFDIRMALTGKEILRSPRPLLGLSLNHDETSGLYRYDSLALKDNEPMTTVGLRVSYSSIVVFDHL